MHSKSILVSTVALGVVLAAGCSSDSGSCPVGAEGCACTAGGGCDGSLVCASNLCVDLGSDGDADADGDVGADADADADAMDDAVDDAVDDAADDAAAVESHTYVISSLTVPLDAVESEALGFDLDGDGTVDALSVGVGVTAVAATFTPPS